MKRRASGKQSVEKLGADFFRRPAETVAIELLGAILVHRFDGTERRARIVETEAYVGPHDLACHASRGRTKRTEVMFGPGGHAYVYLIYGIHEMFNIVSGEKDDPQAVLVRAGEALDGWQANLSGPGNFAKALHISRALNGIDLTGETLFLLGDQSYKPEVVRSLRVGVDYAKEWRNAELRFCDVSSKALSKPLPSL